MRKIARKLLSLLIVVTMLIGVIPTSVLAADVTNTLTLGVEQGFAVGEGDSATFTFTAPEAGTYILYFKEISQWPIGLQFPGNGTEYHSDNGNFQGHVLEMSAGESASLTFRYPDEPPEGYSGYTGTVGVAKKAETFAGFYALEGPDGEGVYPFLMQPQIGMNFFAADPLCYGVTWTVTVADETVLTLDSVNSEPTALQAVFTPHQPGETDVTVTADYEGSTVSNTYRIRITEDGEGGGQGQDNSFATFEELKDLVASAGGEENPYTYTGTDPLVITEDIVINGYLFVPYSAGISGAEHLQFAQEWQRLVIEATVDSTSSLTGLLAELENSHIDHANVQYRISVRSENALTLTQNITIPGYVCVALDAAPSFTVAAGVTVASEGELQIHVPVTLQGTLENNGYMLISHTGANDAGSLDLSGGTITGSGTLQVDAAAGYELSDILSNPADFDVLEEYRQSDFSTWLLKYAGGLIKLGTPTDLSWGTWYEDDGTGNITATPFPGAMSWKTVRPDQARASIKIYDALTGECVSPGEAGFDPQMQPEYRTMGDFILSDLDSGTYYFTVQSLGDYETYRNSDIAKSGTYTYVKPSAQLNPCTDPCWVDKDDLFVSWANYTLPENPFGVAGFELQFFFSPTIDGEYEGIGGVGATSPYGTPGNEVPLEDFFLQEKGVGYYKFRVRLVSSDIERCCNSEWSDFSPALDVKTIPANVNNTLDNILNDPNVNDAASARQAAQALDTTDLKTALLTDQDNTGATAKLADLEQLAGGPAPVTVTSAASAFNPGKVSIVGANLNNSQSEEDPITLVLDKPAANHVIPERYDSAVAVKFSMTLDNVADPENLAVPVKITLPVPSTINPEFLVVLHYHENGEVELLEPYVYEVGGEFFADFVLTSFSDFIMTQIAEEPEHEHVFDREVPDSDYLAAPADCFHPAVYCKSCACGEMGEETFEFGEPLGHSFDGEDSTVCTRCGYKLYAMTAGADQTYYKGSILGLVFRSEARCWKFASVEVDGQVVDPKNYIVGFGIRPAGTVVMLKASYLNTLDVGDHVITIVFADGEAGAAFTVSRRPAWPGLKDRPSWPDWFLAE